MVTLSESERNIGIRLDKPKMNSNEFKPDKLITHLRWPVAIFGGIYFLCMIVAPWVIGGWRWGYVQDVWDRWQAVNVGILAFAASFIAFEAARYSESKQRKREFLATRAFLPEALSELTAYLEDCAAVHMAAWNNASRVTFPSPPTQYKDVFADCIRHADSDTGQQLSALLSEILMWLQVHVARIEGLMASPAHTAAMKQLNSLDGLRLVGELQAKINRLFPFARGLADLDSRPLVWDDYKNAYLNLGVHVENFVINGISLESKTQRHIEDKSNRKAPSHATT